MTNDVRWLWADTQHWNFLVWSMGIWTKNWRSPTYLWDINYFEIKSLAWEELFFKVFFFFFVCFSVFYSGSHLIQTYVTILAIFKFSIYRKYIHLSSCKKNYLPYVRNMEQDSLMNLKAALLAIVGNTTTV